jgi:hypothetical protein
MFSVNFPSLEMGRTKTSYRILLSVIFSAAIGQEVSCYDLFPELKPEFEHRGVVYIPALGPCTLISTATLHPQYVRVYVQYTIVP